MLIQKVRATIYDHFATYFKENRIERPCLDDLILKCLNMTDSGGLFRMVSEEEVKHTMWDCENFKSLGPYGINFVFVKDF